MGKKNYCNENVQKCQAQGPRGLFRCQKSFLLRMWANLGFSMSRDEKQDYLIYLEMGRFATNCETSNRLFWGYDRCRHLVLGQNNITKTIERPPCDFYI